MHLSPRADAGSAGEAITTAMPPWSIALIALIIVGMFRYTAKSVSVLTLGLSSQSQYYLL